MSCKKTEWAADELSAAQPQLNGEGNWGACGKGSYAPQMKIGRRGCNQR
jgi:hypothetical protein